ncbi:MAG TPA: hypothetical protein VES00_07330 [Burkholderiaceae bacterium]|nr:hypothetical protein [Burkholderiaceae bacterium]
MKQNTSWTARGVFKPVGHVLASFPTERDARSAVAALMDAGFPEVLYYAADEMRECAERDIEGAGVLAPFGQELNAARYRRDLASAGHPFVSVRAPETDEARRVADIVARHNADRAQKFGRFVIEELIELGTGQHQFNETPDTGLDLQTRPDRH